MGSPVPGRLPSNRRLALYLVILATTIPEGITGATGPLAWLNPVQLLLIFSLYGPGVLICRELSIRWRTGWAGVLLLGAAYGIVEEGLAVKTFFDPTLAMLGDLGWYGRWAGVNWVWAVWLTIFHAAFSIAFPIFFLEWKYPSIRGRSLLPPWGLPTAGFILLGAVVFDHAFITPYRPGVPEVAGAIAAIGILVWAAKDLGPRLWARVPVIGGLPRPKTYLAASALFWALSFLAYAGGRVFGGTPAVTFVEGGLLLALILLLARRLAFRPDTERHAFALVAGSMATFIGWLVLIDLTGARGFVIPAAVFTVFLWWMWRTRVPKVEAATAPVPAASPPPGPLQGAR